MVGRVAINCHSTGDIYLWTAPHLNGTWHGPRDIRFKTTRSEFYFNDSTWAPDLSYINGVYVLVYTDEHNPGHVGGPPVANATIAYATSLHNGTWILG